MRTLILLCCIVSLASCRKSCYTCTTLEYMDKALIATREKKLCDKGIYQIRDIERDSSYSEKLYDKDSVLVVHGVSTACKEIK